MTKYTGHKLTEDDLYRGTPSVDKESARLCLFEKKRPGAHKGRNAEPSHTSLSRLFTVLTYCNDSQLPMNMK